MGYLAGKLDLEAVVDRLQLDAFDSPLLRSGFEG